MVGRLIFLSEWSLFQGTCYFFGGVMVLNDGLGCVSKF